MANLTSGSRTVFPCNTCSMSFTSSGLQRSHMRGAWHIHNLQRKISGLPALSELEFTEQEDESENSARRKSQRSDGSKSRSQKDKHGHHHDISSTADSGTGSEGYEEQDDDDDDYSSTSSSSHGHHLQPTSTTQCLFCPLDFPHTKETLAHMSTAHSFFIPSSASDSSIEPLLSHLSRRVFLHHECIYCGRTKGSLHSVQSHMRDKGHCRVDEKEYEEFLCGDGEEEEEDGKVEEDETATVLGSTEMRLPSGLIVNSRLHDDGDARRTKQRAGDPRLKTSLHQQQNRQQSVETATSPFASTSTSSSAQTQALTSHSTTHPVSFPDLPNTSLVQNARKQELSLAGLSTEQLRSLVTLDKKMRRQEVSARNKFRDAAMRQPVKTIYYKTENPVYQAG